MSKPTALLLALGLAGSLSLHAESADKLLLFTKSSGFEHEVISWKKGQPSFAEKIFTDLGTPHTWEFGFSKDGSKFSPEYLAGFADAGDSFAFHEEWYSLKDFSPDIHVLTVIDSPAMQGTMYKRPAYPTTS